MKILVTGGAGFIGSHLIDELIDIGYEIDCIDNFSTGKKEYIQHHLGEKNFRLIEGDILKTNIKDVINDCDVVFHLAANPDVKLGAMDTRVHFEQNILATYRILEGMRKKGIKKIAFTSTSTVYGEAVEIPTPEDYGPLIPISLYGASKLSCEALISSYCHTFDMEGVIYRFANVVGPRSTHGVTYDFVNKLRKNPNELEILGDGKQKKSYMHISDCINAMIYGFENKEERVEIFNIGSKDWIDVKKIADIVSQEMGLKPKYRFTGGVDGGRGWKGDVKTMLLSIKKIEELGWKPKYGSGEAIQMTARSLIGE